jgi:hypothetical protein
VTETKDTKDKVDRMVEKTTELVFIVHSFKGDLNIAQSVDTFFYMQKNAELKALVDAIQDSAAQLIKQRMLLDETYRQVFSKWCKERRWLNRCLANRVEGRGCESST